MEKTKGNKKNPQKSTINLKNLPPIDPSTISPPIYQDKYEDPSSRNESNSRKVSSKEGKNQLAGGFVELPLPRKVSSEEGIKQVAGGFVKVPLPRPLHIADRKVSGQNMKVEKHAWLPLPSSSTKLRDSNTTMDATFNRQNQKSWHNVSKGKTAKAELHQLCAANHWKLPWYECCKEEGPSHVKLFTFKVVVEIRETSSATILECFGDPQPNKKMAAEHAAEGALWYLRHLGYYSAQTRTTKNPC